jgi:hypothetical protein
MENTYWEKEEFEDLVIRSLMSLYETKIMKKCFKVPSFIRPSEKDIKEIRSFGCYFPANDRLHLLGDYDLKNDGITKKACLGWDPIDFDYKEKNLDSYFRICHVKLINNIPSGILSYKKIKYFNNQKIYKIIYFDATNKNGIWIQKSYVTMNEEGTFNITYGRHQDDGRLLSLSFGESKEFNIPTDIGYATAVLSFQADTRYLWNVTAKEGIAKATFCVYPEQIKSLFYSREMPLTETGRKRPILHWVAAHQRRIKNGIDIDIEKHLRGITEFTYQGTKFTITRPIKMILIKSQNGFSSN